MRLAHARAWAHLFASRLVATESIRGLALIRVCHTNIYLGYETYFGSPGARLGTLSSRVGGGGDNSVTACATGEWILTYCIYLLY